MLTVAVAKLVLHYQWRWMICFYAGAGVGVMSFKLWLGLPCMHKKLGANVVIKET
jgi:hypothetical protein